jgi:Undecaprenyl-phosphate glucose phosphotransferase
LSTQIDVRPGQPRFRAVRRNPEAREKRASAKWRPSQNTTLVRVSFSFLAAALDFLSILLATVVSQLSYNIAAYQWYDLSAPTLKLSLIAAATFLLANAARHEYTFANYVGPRGHAWRCFSLWSVVSLLALAIGFLAKATEEASRAAFLLSSTLAFIALVAQRAMLSHLVRSSAATGGVSARRIFLVGFEKEIKTFSARYKPWTCGMSVVATVALRESEQTLGDDLALAAASARMLRPDDVFILAPWSRADVIDECVEAFLRVPARLHLGPERVLDRFSNAQVDKVGAISSLNLSGHPLDLFEMGAKRVFDIVVSGLALVALSPALLICALVIRLESKGSALFYQRRYGFNRETFRIVKFRTMTTMEDGRHVRQATVNDPRVTRVGRFLRRYNIDELPQLFNVLRGEMSLVGPRPHAVAHDQLFEQRIALYARRHNVKPGMTGWAQVNGLRGEIDSPEKIRQRIEHDLYYIDNCSLIFDLWILFLTVFSRKAYRNAF